MSEIISAIDLSPEFYTNLVLDSFVGKTLHLGIIPGGTNLAATLHMTDRAAVIAAEYNGAGWLRPATTYPSAGTYDNGTGEHAAPQIEFAFTGPTGGLSFEQYFIIYDGSIDTPRDTTGTLIRLFTATQSVTVAQGSNFTINVDLTLFAAPNGPA